MLDQLDNLLVLAKNAHEQKKYDMEIDYLNNALKLETNKSSIASIYEKIGSSLYLLKRNGEAKKYFLFALKNLQSLSKNEPKESIGLVNYKLGSVFFDDGDYEKSLMYTLKAFQYVDYLSPEEAFMVVTAIGVNYENLDQHDKAIEFYHRSIEVPGIPDEDKAMILQFLGQCYDKKGNKKKAFDYFYKLFSIDPNYDDGWYLKYRYAQLAYHFRNYRISKKYFLKIINQIPSDRNSYLQSLLQCLGYIYIEKKEHKRAIIEFKKALKIKSDSSRMRAEIYCGIAQAYFGLNKIWNTIKFGLKALDEQFDEATAERVYFLLAYSYSLKRNKEKENIYTEKLKGVKQDSAYLREL